MKEIEIDQAVPDESRTPGSFRKWFWRLAPALLVLAVCAGVWLAFLRRSTQETERDHVRLATDAYAREDFAEAAILFKKVLDAQPGKHDYRLNLAICQLRLGQTEEARRTLEAALVPGAHLGHAYLLLGEIELAALRFSRAREHGSLALQNNADQGRALRLTAHAALAMDDLVTGIPLLVRAVALNPDILADSFTLARRLEMASRTGTVIAGAPDWHDAYRQTAARARTAWAANPDDLGAGQVLVESLAAIGETEEALRVAGVLRDRRPESSRIRQLFAELLRKVGHEEMAAAQVEEDAEAYSDPRTVVQLAASYRVAGDVERSISVLRAAMDRSPEVPGFPIFLGNLLAEEGRSADARQVLEAALVHLPDHPLILIALGALEQDQGRPEEAIAAYRKALQGTDSPLAVRFRIAGILLPAMLGEYIAPLPSTPERLALAREIVDALIAESPESIPALTFRAMLALAEGRPRDALPPTARIEELAPGHRNAAWYSGLALLALARPGAAADRIAASIDPIRPDPRRRKILLTAQLAARRNEDAVLTVKAMLADKPDDPELLVALGIALTGAGRASEALTPLSTATEADPPAARAFMALGRALAATGDGGRALAALRRARQIEDSPSTRRALASFLLTVRRPDEASEVFAGSPELGVEQGDLLLATGDVEGAARAYDRAAASDPDDPLLLARQADLLFARSELRPEDRAKLEQIRDEVTRLEPDGAAARYLAARLHLLAGRPAEAEALLRAIEESSAAIPLVSYLRGLSLAALQRKDEAIEELTAAAESLPGFSRARLLLAQLLLERSLAKTLETGSSSALGDLQAAVSLSPGNGPANRMLAEAAFQTGRSELGEAQCRLLLDHDPKDGLALFLLAGHRFAQGDIAAARQLTARLLAVAPENPSGWLRLAVLDLAEKRFADALKNLEECARKGESALCTQLTAMALIGLARPQEATALLAKRVSDHPDDDSTRLGLARYLAGQGQAAEAERHLRVLTDRPSPLLSAAANLVAILAAAGREKECLPIAAGVAERLGTPESLHFLACRQILAGLPQDAHSTLVRARERAPDDLPCLLLDGELLTALGRPADALALLRKAEAAAPASPVVLLRLGEALAAADQKTTARDALTRALAAVRDPAIEKEIRSALSRLP